jgi:hypothetical protein
MARFEDVLGTLGHYRVALQTAIFADVERQGQISADMPVAEARPMLALSRGGASPATATPLTNVHATGAGIRVRGGKVVPGDFVLKVYVFEKLDLGDATPDLTRHFEGVDIDVEPLPVQLAAARAPRRSAQPQRRAPARPAAIRNRNRHRPIPGGVSIAPLNEDYVGTLGCFVRRVRNGTEQIFALSNNHVLADVNTLAVGTPIVQPGPETAPTTPADAFATLSSFIPIRFPTSRGSRPVNRFDAAIARITDAQLIRTGSMLDIANYTPDLAAPVPGTAVTKSGRTSGVTTGTITAIQVNGVQVNYGTRFSPRIAVFNEVIEIVGDDDRPFSMPGDSGSVILERRTGRPVALLFAGDGRTTDACDIAGVCRQFQVLPV